MNLFKNPFLKVAGLLALVIVLGIACADTPKDPNANSKPDTFISTYNINTSPDSAAFYSVTVYWRASDANGQAEYYRYWVDAGAETTFTFDTSARIRLQFDQQVATHTFYVEARDNQGDWDPTPASIAINITDVRDISAFNPETAPITVPPNGALTSRGVIFVINGNDIDGSVLNFQWAVDDTANWHIAAPTLILSNSSTLELGLTPDVLTIGPHTIFVRSVDNFGNVDESPLSMSIDARDGFAPELALSVRNDESFVVPFTTPTMDSMQINLTTTVDFYYGAIRDYFIYTSTGFAETTTSDVVTLTNLIGGNYWIKVVANDIGGNSTVDSTNFAVVVLGPHQGILGVNGVDWASYGAQATALWENAVPFGNFPHFKWWDLFLVPPGGGRAFPDSLLGTGSIPGWMFDTTYFAAIVWCANEFSGDEVYWNERNAEVMNYLNNGGNLILATRFGADFFFDELTAFAGIDPAGWVTGVNPGSLVAVGDSLTNISRIASQSLTDIPAVSGSSTRVLYEDPARPGLAAGLIAEPPGLGKFVFIAGRNYRWTGVDLKANLDVIYRFYFNMRNQY